MSLFTQSASASEEESKRRERVVRVFHRSRLNDLLHLSLQRNDLPRARYAWSILIRNNRFDWKLHWRVGLAVLPSTGPDGDSPRMEYLKRVFVSIPEEKESILKEIVLELIAQGRYTTALDQLELYLNSFPFQDNPTMHMYAGMLCMYMSQHSKFNGNMNAPDLILLRAARAHFQRSLEVDPSNDVATTYREMVDKLRDAEALSEDEDMA